MNRYLPLFMAVSILVSSCNRKDKRTYYFEERSIIHDIMKSKNNLLPNCNIYFSRLIDAQIVDSIFPEQSLIDSFFPEMGIYKVYFDDQKKADIHKNGIDFKDILRDIKLVPNEQEVILNSHNPICYFGAPLFTPDYKEALIKTGVVCGNNCGFGLLIKAQKVNSGWVIKKIVDAYSI